MFTPTPDCFLDGITRRTVIDLAGERGLAVTERAIWPEELESFEQCFLTGSAAEVTPVAEIGPWQVEVGSLTRQLALDLRPLRVNLISPGAVETELWDGLPAEKRGEMMEGFAKKMATGRVGRPEDVAESYLYCMRDGNVTGSVVSSNGGHLVM